MKDWFPALLVLLLILAGPARADLADDITQVNTRLKQFEGKTLSPDDQAQHDRYQQALDALQSAQQYETRTEALRKELVSLPDEITALRKTLDREAKEPEKPDSHLASLSLDQLQQRQTLLKASLLEQHKALDRLQQDITLNDQKRSTLREQLSKLKQSNETPPELEQDNSDAAMLLKSALFREHSAQVQVLELELLALPGRSELNGLKAQQLNRAINSNETTLQTLEELSQRQLRSQTEQTLSGLKQGAAATSNPALQDATEQNQELSGELRDTLASIEQTSNLRRQQEQQLKRVDEAYRTISQQLELDVKYVGTELYRLQAGLTRPLDTAATRAQINQLRLQNLRLNRDQLAIEQELGGYETSTSKRLPADILGQYRQLLSDRLALYNQLRDARLNLIGELSSLLTVQESINERIAQARALIGEQLLWLPSVSPIQLNWFSELAESRQVLLEHWQNEADQPLLHFTPRMATPLTGLVVLTILAMMLIRYHRRKVPQWQQAIGNVMRDRFWNTIRLLLFAPLIALPLPVLLLIFAQYLLNPEHPDYMALQRVLQSAALTLWIYQGLRIWLYAPGGLFISHFGVDRKLAGLLRQRLSVLLASCGPPLLAVIYIYMVSLDSVALKSGLERLLMMLLATFITLLWASLLQAAPLLNKLTLKDHWWLRAEVWLGALVTFNILLLGMMLLGYVFTSQVFMRLLLSVLLAFLTVFVCYRLGLRWLLIAERRLAFDRALARRAEIMAAREKNEEEAPVSTDYLNMQAISEQSRKLLVTVSVILLLSLLWLVLRDFLPVLDVLDKVVLWSSVSEAGGGQALTTSITLKNLLFAGILLWLSTLAASNLPGLLELLVLRHMTLSPGSGYAITTLIKYILIVIGVLVSVGELGLQWAKLQWLVAALGVGLGFGLQEIVANFVSGLIILFEKPMRIGDTVTIGELTGTVTRIQIRGTTIVDWDRKEVIIPNKTFITDRLINWSLTDPTTRVVIQVGVAYGSDTERACKLLIEAARETTRVLTDPPPEAFFTGFGASTLDLELRLFVSTMQDRIVVRHNVNRAIDRKFRDAGIEIAFPQLDVHYHPIAGTGPQSPSQGET